jgi:hypothetical protein
MKIHATDAISALSELVEMGFTHDFRIQNGQLVDVSTGIRANPSDVTVVTKLRFETELGSGDASNVYALDVGNGASKGFLVDALDLEGEGAPQDLIKTLSSATTVSTAERSEGEDYRYGVRKVRKSEFNADPDRYILRIGFPDFPECPFGQGFTMLGFDTAQQEYVWLVTKIIKDDRLQRVPYQGSINDE